MTNDKFSNQLINNQLDYLNQLVSATGVTDRGFTGHKENRSIGLTFMNARYYVSSIGRFASADTIIPDPGSSQAYNRYAYVENRPILFTDPSGHIGICIQGGLESNDPDMKDGSSVRDICEKLQDGEDPLILGDIQIIANDSNSLNSAVVAILQALEKNPNEEIFVLGYSWGAGGALELVHHLHGINIKVDTLVLLDAVLYFRDDMPFRSLKEVRKPQAFGVELNLDDTQNSMMGIFDYYLMPSFMESIVGYDWLKTVSLPDNIGRALNLYATHHGTRTSEGIRYVEGALNGGIYATHRGIVARNKIATIHVIEWFLSKSTQNHYKKTPNLLDVGIK